MGVEGVDGSVPTKAGPAGAGVPAAEAQPGVPGRARAVRERLTATRFFPSPQAARVRRVAEPDPRLSHVYDDEFRVDLERIRFSPYFSRLSAVTQVIPQAGSGTVIHNRLTHTLKVTAVARSIAMGLRAASEDDRETIVHLGGCDPVVVQAAAAAHDLGHPPFGHLGEHVLDRLARDRLGLADGFEGNAQTLRIVAALDTCDAAPSGLNLTAGVRAAVLKYPWTRGRWRGLAGTTPAHLLPRGVGRAAAAGAAKFSCYVLEEQEMRQARAAYPAVAWAQQTVECAIMDIADDIAYSVHDLDDFYRAGVLQRSVVAAEFDAWLAGSTRLAALGEDELAGRPRTPGYALEATWRAAFAKDGWIADKEAFVDSVRRVQEDLVDGLLDVPYDGGVAADHAVAGFTRRWIDRLSRSVVVERHPNVRGSHVRLTRAAWHDVVVLKFVHAHFVLHRPDLAIYQRGHARVIETLVRAFADWLADPDDAPRVPRRLADLVDAATAAYADLAAAGSSAPSAACGGAGRDRAVAGPATVEARGRGRAIVDYIASLTDAQALSAAALIGGGSVGSWEDGRSL
ncbi:MAG TPA: dNTP triphosphohydrolase [Microbacteriaceae bacterium]|nr:dNTP triphosphohydrolase [Microbacteriaceae bacterium]